MDILQINNIKLPATIGVYNWEQEIKQTIILDLALGLKKNVSDEKVLADTIDYKTFYDELETFINKTSEALIENLAEKIAYFIFKKNTLVEILTLTIKKPHAIKADVAFTINRKREEDYPAL